MSIPFHLGYAGSTLDENVEIAGDGSQVRLKTVDEIAALYHFNDPEIGGFLVLAEDAVHPGPEAKATGINGVIQNDNPNHPGAYFYDSSHKIILPTQWETWGQFQDLTLRFRYCTWSNWMDDSIISRGYSDHFSFRIFAIRDGLGLECSSDGLNTGEIIFDGRGDIQPGTLYEVQAVMGEDRSAALSLNGHEKVSIENWNFLPLYNPAPNSLLPLVLYGKMPEPGSGTQMLLSELIVYKKKMPIVYTPASGSTKPFRTQGQCTLVLDSGSLLSRWYPSSLSFVNDEAFSKDIGLTEALTISYGLGNQPDPELIPGWVTLQQFHALSALNGRYLKLRFNFLSDQEYPTTLDAGWINCTPAIYVPRIIERQQPEIVRR